MSKKKSLNQRSKAKQINMIGRSITAFINKNPMSRGLSFGFLGIVTAFLIIGFIYFSQPAESQKNQEFNEETAKLISQIPSNAINSDDSIKVVFVNPVTKIDEIKKPLTKDVFSFSPTIKGKIFWENPRTLVLKPDEPLKPREKYSGHLNLKELIPNLNEKVPQKLFLYFEVTGQDILNFSGEFVRQVSSNSKQVRFEGKMIFNLPADIKKIRNSVKMVIDGKICKLEWREGSNSNEYLYKSSPFKKTSNRQWVEIKADKNDFDLSEDFSYTTSLTPINKFEVQNVKLVENGLNPSLEIVFSDKLDDIQDITGLIETKPPVKMKTSRENNKIYLNGNFEYGDNYELVINKNLSGEWGNSLEAEFKKDIAFNNIKPAFTFSSEGSFLPSTNKKTILFKTINIKNVDVSVMRVFENNLCQFLQSDKLTNNNQSDFEDNSDKYSRVGVVIAKQKLEISDKKNIWLQNAIDLNKLLKNNEKGLFIISLSFTKEDMAVDLSSTYRSDDNRGDYYNDYYFTNADYYVSRYGKISKPVILSDIGLTYKKAGSNHYVFASDITDAEPVSTALITIRSYQNQIIAKGITDKHGIAELKNDGNVPFFIEAEKDGQKSVVVPRDMEWNLSTFDVSGRVTDPKGIKAFIYTERGVYRPGDEINFSLIARNDSSTFPEDHPVTINIFNPKGQKLYQAVSKESEDGFYSFPYKTNASDPTGQWQAKFIIGGSTLTHSFNVETIVPYLLKVSVNADKKTLTRKDNRIHLKVDAKYLAGNPAAEHKVKINRNLKPVPKTFKGYQDYFFENKEIAYAADIEGIAESYLNKDGQYEMDYALNDIGNPPSALSAVFNTDVFERTGRPVPFDIQVPIDPYDYYVGIENEYNKDNYVSVGKNISLNFVCIDKNGKPAPGRKLSYKIYRNERYWWWEYDENQSNRYNFKNDKYTELLDEKNIISKNTPVQIKFTPEKTGEYLLEVVDTDEGGHSASCRIRASFWESSNIAIKEAGILELKTDKKIYHPGEEAMISFPAPKDGVVLYSVEKGLEVLAMESVESEGNGKDMTIRIPITEKMIPNAYAVVSVIQPHAQTVNDRPIRLYGAAPLVVEKKETHQELIIKTADELKPKESFSVEINTKDKKRMQFTIAIVDEGLLDITAFKTPDAWADFYAKQALGVITYDLFSSVLGVNKGDIFKRFSIGGGGDYEEAAQEETYRKSQLAGGTATRFKPVSMFKGPLSTDSDGHARIDFEMPDYNGSVRIMVVSARNENYGKAEKTVPVRSDIMLFPSFPRFMSPGDKITSNITVFSTKEYIKDVDVTIQTEGPVKVISEARKSVSFIEPGEKNIQFELTAANAVGTAKIKVTAKGGNFTTEKTTEINISSSAPRIYDQKTALGKAGQSAELQTPNNLLEGTVNAELSISRVKNYNFGNKLQWLIHYPYGCIEQTTSSVFPQLYLKKFIAKNASLEKEIDKNINAGINRLRTFQLSSGGFSYWPGGTVEDMWGTNYAGHFLLEAKKLGYNVANDMIEKWINYERSSDEISSGYLMENTYRLYLLALAGEAEIGAMNSIRENSLKDMTNTQKWLLAAAYYLAGVKDTANNIIRKTGFSVTEYRECGGTYGSDLRDKAIILDLLTLMKRYDDMKKSADEIAQIMNDRNWYSTQESAYTLLALGKYMLEIDNEKDQGKEISGFIILPDGRKQSFKTDQTSYSIKIDKMKGDKIKVILDKDSKVKTVFVTLEWNGVPMKPDLKTDFRNFTLTVDWLDEEGNVIDPASLAQQTTFWQRIIVTKMDAVKYRDIENMALVQVLPAGWEIENTRLSNEDIPGWMNKSDICQPDYVDIRDDRIMWFFDSTSYQQKLKFFIKLNTVTPGEYTLPPTLLEAMYDNNYKALLEGKKIKVTSAM